MKYFVTALLMVLGAQVASAQLTITSADFLSGVHQTSTVYSSNDVTGAATLIASTGSGVTWNFGGRTYDAGQVSNMANLQPYPAGAALATDPAFNTATHVVIDSSSPGVVIYEFLKINSTGAWILGESQDSMGTKTKLLVLSPAWQFMKFPLTLGTSWTSTSQWQLAGLPPGLSYTITNENLVDGEGTLTTPPGTNTPSLRLRTKQTAIYSYPPFLYDTSISYSYNWYTKAGYGASISADSANVPQSMSYTVPGGTVTPTPGVAWQSGTSGDFGTVAAGSVQNKTFTLRDTSSAAVQITGVTFTGANASEFSAVGTFPATVQAGQSLGVNVIWTPGNTSGSHTATMSVLLADGSISPLTLQLTGSVTGGTPTAGVKWLTGTSGDFGTVNVGATPAKTLTVVDTSSVAAQIQGVTFTGANASEFSVAGTFPMTIASGASLPLVVTWTPNNVVGSHSATMTVALSNEGASPITLNLTGTVTSLGVADQGNSSFDVVLRPNPITSSGTVTVTSADAGLLEWSIVDPLGRVQYRSVDLVFAGPNALKISADQLGLASGAYYLKATLNGQSITRSIVIAK